MSVYRVEKRVAEVVLLMCDGSRAEGKLYLAPLSASRSGGQTVPDLMSESGPVLPFHRADGHFVLVGKSSVVAVRLQDERPPQEDLFVRFPGKLALSGSHLLRGHLMAEKGIGQRVSDLLNTAENWLLVETGEGVHWVAKHHLLTLEPEEG